MCRVKHKHIKQSKVTTKQQEVLSFSNHQFWGKQKKGTVSLHERMDFTGPKEIILWKCKIEQRGPER